MGGIEVDHWKHMVFKDGEKQLLVKLNIKSDESYEILACDLANMWREVLSRKGIKEKCKVLNRRLEAPTASIIEHLRTTVTAQKMEHFHLEMTSHECLKLTIKNTFESGIPFLWEFSCAVVDNKECLGHFVSPLLKLTASLQCANQELQKIIKQKDAEIQDYKESGAVVTRPYLETEEFDAGAFQRTFREGYGYCKAITKDPFTMASDASLNTMLTQVETDSKLRGVIEKAAGEPTSPKSFANNKTGGRGFGQAKKRAARKVRRPPRGVEVASDSDDESDSCKIDGASQQSAKPKEIVQDQKKVVQKKKALEKKRKKLF